MLKRYVLMVASLAAFIPACAAPADDGEATSSDALTSTQLVGSWTVAKGALQIPDVPFRTVAGLVLRADGTYFAQVAPREIAGPRFTDDSHTSGMRDGLELVGAWQGIEGTWTLASNGTRLNLVRPGGGAQPDLVLELAQAHGELSLTNRSYAGRQTGKTDTLRRVADDCRATRVVKTGEELAADDIEAQVLGLGTEKSAPPSFQLDLVGEVQQDPALRCHESVTESSLRTVWKDGASGRLRAVSHLWSDLSDARVMVEREQHYVYDEQGALRLIVTTTQHDDLGGRAVSDVPRLTFVQERTYFDSTGHESRTLVQPHLEQARSLVGLTSPFEGRRFDALTSPIGVVDLPVCVSSGARVPSIAKDPTKPEVSLAAPPVCRAH